MNRSDARDGLETGGVVLLVLVVIGLIGAAVWGIGVLVSPARGAGDAYAQKNSAANWTVAQARFEDEYADIVATDRKLTATADDADDDSTPGDTWRGLQSYCLSVVGEYNADARKYLTRDFRAADLPAQIDDLDPATDCEPVR